MPLTCTETTPGKPRGDGRGEPHGNDDRPAECRPVERADDHEAIAQPPQRVGKGDEPQRDSNPQCESSGSIGQMHAPVRHHSVLWVHVDVTDIRGFDPQNGLLRLTTNPPRPRAAMPRPAVAAVSTAVTCE